MEGDKEKSSRVPPFYNCEHKHSRHDDHRERLNAIKNPFTSDSSPSRKEIV